MMNYFTCYKINLYIYVYLKSGDLFMDVIAKNITFILLIFFFLIFFSLFTNLQNSVIVPQNVSRKVDSIDFLVPFTLKDSEITFDESQKNLISENKNSESNENNNINETVLNRAKAMTEVKWIPKNNMRSKEGNYTFIKGKTYTGIPYSMSEYQAASAEDFLSRINNSKVVLGNDCSGFVSAAWGIARQTTLTLFEAIKSGGKINGRSVTKISWEDLKPGDALLRENGNGKGHIVLYIGVDTKDTDSLQVFEQNIGTIIPYEPIPTARKDTRSKKTLIKNGYFPIRLN